MGSRLGIEKSAAKKLGITVEEWRNRREAGTLWCYCCKTWKDEACFGVDSSRSTGHTSACKTCVSHKATACRYGLRVSAARDLRGGDRKCDICGRKQKLEVDHNHKTGKVRGLLCSRCNGALGQFCDAIELLEKAIAYLKVRDGS